MSRPSTLAYLIFVALLASAAGLRGGRAAPIGLAIGLLGWTLVEYLVHRFVFHPARIAGYRLRLPALLRSHGRHHEVPGEMAVGLLPAPVVLPFVGAAALAGWWLGGPTVPAALAGLTLGYVGYHAVHFAMHRAPSAPRGLQALWDHHEHHHQRAPGRAFGVTTTLWDRLLGTMP